MSLTCLGFEFYASIFCIEDLILRSNWRYSGEGESNEVLAGGGVRGDRRVVDVASQMR